ncbi:MAG: ABC transporter substrate-binding protein, partial [Candidatus Marinimicrobia bacterium]|nr:ABC transporter substrate-binding protein [Candidatus Neomarinimicrobiota bacterium]
FVLTQNFKPDPLINMLVQMGFETLTEQVDKFRFKNYFYKPIDEEKVNVNADKKVPVVIQSATPITYPIIMKMLQSKELMSKIDILELKVWEETEKHMGWIINGKADISFSAVAAGAKMYLVGTDIKMTSVDIWDNFSILTRGYKADNFGDLKGHKIHLPLFTEAPPAVITNYLMKNSGYDPNDFEFVFAKPFGRPPQIMNDFISGKADTVLLREPEASFARYAVGEDAHLSISYTDVWQKIGNNKKMQLPNAGLIFKGEFLKNHPDIAELFIKVLKESIEWVNNNKKESSEMAYDIMRQEPKAVEYFLNNAHLEHVPTPKIKDQLYDYLRVIDKKAAKNMDKLDGLFL